jgi:peptide chain release factor 3
MGAEFQGVYDLWSKSLLIYNQVSKQKVAEGLSFSDLSSPELVSRIGEPAAKALREELELVRGVYPEFDRDLYLSGQLQPVFFGSALNNFGVRELLNCFTEIAPSPQPKQAEERMVRPDEVKFSGFVFKIHANIDPNHRSRIAFVKVVSGTFERNTNYFHVREGKSLKFSSPMTFLASKREVVEKAYPGDIVGLPDTGLFRIGDSLTAGESLHFSGIPSFSPEHFRFINNADPLKSKQLAKGVDQLMDEGVAQLFTLVANGRKVIGTVGALQYEVIQYRLEHEYGAKCSYEPFPAYKALWIEGDLGSQLEEFQRMKARQLATDKFGRLVFLADSQFGLQLTQEKFSTLSFHEKSEF